MKVRSGSTLVVLAMLGVSSVRAADTCPAAAKKDIVDTAVAAGSFKTLAQHLIMDLSFTLNPPMHTPT